MSAELTLLECPFCGGKARFCDRWESIHDLQPTSYTAYCDDCDIETPRFETADEAAETWNTRTK